MLHDAANVGCWQIVEKIINFMIKHSQIFDDETISNYVNSKNKVDGETALMIACRKGDEITAQILCNHEFVDMFIVDNNDKTPTDYLRYHTSQTCFFATYDLRTGQLLNGIRELPGNISKNKIMHTLLEKMSVC